MRPSDMNPDVVEVKEPNKKVRCDFCDRYEIDALMWGPMYQLDGVTTHYFCLVIN
jgi:hypothetical protein